MSIAVNRVTNAGVYLAGNAFLGRAEKVTLPTLKLKMSDHRGLGMVGAMDLPDGIEKMDGSILWNSYYPDALARAADTTRTVQLQVRAAVESYTAAGLTDQSPLVCTMSVLFSELPLGTFEHQKPATVETKFCCYAAKTQIGATVILDYDVFANRYSAAGADVLALFREIVG